MSTYQPGIPTGTVNLDQDYLNIQGNFQQLDTSFGVDHLPFSNNSAQNGYHASIHYNPVSTIVTNPPSNYPLSHAAIPPSLPPVTPGFGQLFSAQVNDKYDTDEALFWMTGGDKLIQLTSNIIPKIQANGYTFLPGGLIIQWGVVAGSNASSTPVLFATANKNFATACFGVWIMPVRSSTNPGDDFATSAFSVSTTGFTIGNIGGHTMQRWYWIAIGQ